MFDSGHTSVYDSVLVLEGKTTDFHSYHTVLLHFGTFCGVNLASINHWL